MTKKVLVLFSLIFFLFSTAEMTAQKTDREAIKKKLVKEHMQNSSAQGREFWIAIPPNEVPEHGTNVLELYVTSSENTMVEFWMPGRGQKLTKPLEAMSVVTFSTETGEMSWGYEVRTSEKVTHEGIRLSADQPISVYVLNGKPVTSEGYLAVPVTSWGRKYIHCSYYDFLEGREWASGFLLVSGSNNTRIKIKLKGLGKGYAKTLHGRDIGDNWEVTLNEGQTYMVRGDATTRGQFDMSGSEFIGSKPFGLISFHMRTMIPALVVTSGRDHLAEMMPPVTAWGKRYATVEYNRGTDKGDFFRIIAAEPNTRYAVRWYDRTESTLIGQREGVLKNAGDFQEFLETPATMPHDLQSIRGTSIFEADKPVLVLQYSYSAHWDNAGGQFDPFMILVTAVEQYIPGTVFQTPANKAFNDNHFNIIAIGDTADEKRHFELLKSIELDDVPIWKNNQQFLFNRIPETNLYWAKLKVDPGPHEIQGDTKFGGYVYGFSTFDSYGWPAAMAFNTIGEIDSLPPLIYIDGHCGNYEIRLTELRNGEEGDDPIQIDKGIDDVVELEESYNFKINMEDFKAWPPNYDYTFEYNVEDPYKDGFVVFSVLDRAGNINMDSIRYEADSLLLDPEEVDFGLVKVNTTKEMPVELISSSDDKIKINTIELKYGEVFAIEEGSAPPEFDLASRDVHDLLISYTPDKEAPRERDQDIDSLIVHTECLRWAWPIYGRGVIPRIEVGDFDAGTVVVNNTVCKKADQNRGLLVSNPGTDTLEVTDIKGVEAPFTLSDPTVPALPFKVAPGETIYLEEMCFSPTEVGEYSLDITFVSNGQGPDSVSLWEGKSVQPGPYITSYDWHKRRVKTINEAEIYIRNQGSSPVTITNVPLETPNDPNFRITSVNPSPNPEVELYPEDDPNPNVSKEIVVTVEFEPQSEETYHNAVVPEFDEGDGIEEGSVVGDIDGIGILPKLTVEGYVFWPPILLGDTHDDTGIITIHNPSETSETYIESIRWSSASPTPQDFEWITSPAQDFNLDIGETIDLEVEFTSAGINERNAIVEVISDASPGPEEDPRVTDTVWVTGHAYEKGITVNNLDFGDVLLCDEPEDNITIENTSTTTVAEIYDVVLETGDIGSFEIQTNFPQSLNPGDPLPVDIRFTPSVADRTGPYYAEAKVYSSFDTLTSIIEAEVYEVHIDLDMPTIHGMAAGMQTIDNPPASAFPVTVQSSEWGDAEITDFTVEIMYKNDWLVYTDKIARGEVLDQSWDLQAEETLIDEVWSMLTVEGHGTTPISRNGQLFRPRYTVLLSDSSKFNPEFGEVSFSARDLCVTNATQPGEIHTNACVQDLRNVTIGTTKYVLHEVGPNPATGGTVNVKYGVGLKTRTVIELYNSTGEKVETLIDEIQKVGKYEMTLNTSELSSGAYIIRMKSGPFEQVRNFVISK